MEMQSETLSGSITSSESEGGILDRLEDRVRHSKLSRGLPAKELAGLPLRRVIPMDVHAVMDYSGAGTLALSSSFADTPEAKAAGLALGATVAAASLLTDYRLSLAKVIPIEVHETLDYVAGFSSLLAPVLLGYWKRDPVASAMQMITGAMQIVGSLFTDYRAQRGVTWSHGR